VKLNETVNAILDKARIRIAALQFGSGYELLCFLEEESAFMAEFHPSVVVDEAINRGYFRMISMRYTLALNAAIDYALELVVSGAITTEDELRTHLKATAPNVAPWFKSRDVLTDLFIEARQKNLYVAIHQINRPILIDQPEMVGV
jgi:hypothetical protein